jgi:hypothetical protein
MGFVSAVAGAAVVASNANILTAYRWAISFGLSQVVFLLGLYFVMLFVSEVMVAGYIAWIEERINKLAGERVANWESKISGPMHFSLGRAFGFSSFFLGLFIIVLDIWLIYQSVQSSPGWTGNDPRVGFIIDGIGVFEIFVLITSLVMLWRDGLLSQTMAADLMKRGRRRSKS